MIRNQTTSTFTNTPLQSLAFLAKKNASSDQKDETIWIEKGKVRLRIPVQNILYVKAEHVYCRLFFPFEQQVLKRISLDRLTAELPSDKFIRVHRSYLVNVDFIERFNASKILVGEVEIPIGRTWRKGATNRLRQLLG